VTSGSFTSLSIPNIFVDRDERQRKKLDPAAVRNLADSIAKVGLIHPIVVERSGKLCVGETRLEACKLLGWTSIPAQFTDELDESALQLMELDENIKRSNLTWQEECEAVARYHALRSVESGWTQSKTAEALGMSENTVSERLNIQKELVIPTSRVHNATKYSEAKTIVTRQASRKAESRLAQITNDAPVVTERKVPLIHDDFNEWALAYDGQPFNFIHCDFPYGINADNQQQGGNVTTLGGYSDTEDVYWDLVNSLEAFMINGVANSAHIMFWFSMKFYEQTRGRLEGMGWKIDPFPLIWHKSDNAGLLPDPQRGGRRVYETAFFGSRGDRKVVQPVANHFSGPTTKHIHMSEKPKPMLEHFFRMFVDEYTTFLDPTAGSANAVQVAARKGARSVCGLERDENFLRLATENFHDDD
jgi:ParB/RepB/Spo0J family partition protein